MDKDKIENKKAIQQNRKCWNGFLLSGGGVFLSAIYCN